MTFTYRDPSAKLKHIEACLLPESQYIKTTGLENFELSNEAGVSLSLLDIDLTTQFCGRKFGAPIMISPMTGGVERGAELNRQWAKAAEKYQLPMGVGSQRIALEQGDLAGFFQIRKHAPTAFIFANLGAANLNLSNGVVLSRRAVEMVRADALFIHFNAMQEACQGGDTDFRQALNSLEAICKVLRADGVKVFAREVGFGMSKEAVRRFASAGVDGVDCSGAGGTSWSKVESMCASNEYDAKLGAVFGEWGIGSADSIINARAQSEKLALIASGGIRSGLDVAKAIALGADLVGIARPFLLAATQGEAALHRFIEATSHELKIAMFASGHAKMSALKKSPIRRLGILQGATRDLA